MREYMAKLWSTKELLGQYERGVRFWRLRLNYCSFKYLLIIFKRGIIPRNISNIRKKNLVSPFIWKVPQEAIEDLRQKLRRVNQETLRYETRVHDLN